MLFMTVIIVVYIMNIIKQSTNTIDACYYIDVHKDVFGMCL